MIHDIEFGGKASAKPESDSQPAAAGAAASSSGSGAPAAAGAAATSSGSGAPPLPLKKVGGRGRGRPLRRRDTEDSERSDSAVEFRKSVEEAIDEVMTKSR